MNDGYYYEVELQDYVNQGVGSCLRIDSNDINFLRELHLDIVFKMSKRSKEMKGEKCCSHESCDEKRKADEAVEDEFQRNLKEFLRDDPGVKSW